MSDNEFTLDGVTYVAVEHDGHDCQGCAFLDYDCTEFNCYPESRFDYLNVIFVEKVGR